MKGYTMKFDSYHMRIITINDIDQYYRVLVEESDDEAMYYTGSINSFSAKQISDYVRRIVNDTSRFDFLILQDNRIIGEVVINNIENKTCNYRICIFKKENFSKGIGFKATVEVLKFAFMELELDSIELEVYPFNERGIALYKKLGFEVSGEVFDDEAKDPYRNLIAMRLDKSGFKEF